MRAKYLITQMLLLRIVLTLRDSWKDICVFQYVLCLWIFSGVQLFPSSFCTVHVQHTLGTCSCGLEDVSDCYSWCCRHRPVASALMLLDVCADLCKTFQYKGPSFIPQTPMERAPRWVPGYLSDLLRSVEATYFLPPCLWRDKRLLVPW